jgi:phosphatidylinositol glycan class N
MIRYINNIRLVDQGLRRVEQLVESYYEHDGKTAYIFTSDHGMGNRGKYALFNLKTMITHIRCSW